MLTPMKKYWFCLLLLISFCFPLSAKGIQFHSIPLETTHHQRFDSSPSLHKEASHPPKKKPKKNKRGNILNKKHKMRNGHSCPSF
jgi:hypothetical protein